jgi:HlyD family secretion protein
MKKLTLMLSIFFATIMMQSCSDNEIKSDAFGNFEATETIVSAEGTGKLLSLNVEEGMTLEEGMQVGFIDTVQLYLKKKQIYSQKIITGTKFGNINSQAEVYREQMRTAQVEKNRIENLIKDNAASQKQLDDINGTLNTLQKQVEMVMTQNNTVKSEFGNFDVQVQQIEDQIEKSIIKNPVRGTVLMKLAEPGEIMNFGKPLYKIADLSFLNLRVFVSGEQLPKIKIGQKVKVLIDDGKEGFRELEGTISWISSKSEFTPKIIQTKEERVNLVYAVKIKVSNEGSLKIGMPGEVIFN